MSQLQRSFMQAKLAHLPPEAPIPLEVDEENDNLAELSQDRDLEDSSSLSSASSAGTIRPSASARGLARSKGIALRNDNESSLNTSWFDYFETELYLPFSKNGESITYHAYLTSPRNNGPLFVTHHGAGSSGLSFATCAAEIRKILPDAGVLSPDARGHGDTQIMTDNSIQAKSLDLSLEVLDEDLVNVINLTQKKIGWESIPKLVLVGHSLGGAVVTNIAAHKSFGDTVIAYAVLDVVEGSAMDALKSMHTYLSTRPTSFPSISSAVEWHVKSRTIRNSLSASVSVPSLLRETTQGLWQWRTDLAATQPFWENWFIGLSTKFLSGNGGKLLLLAGTDRLDKELMIGQMQGKYQLQVFPEAGHFIHEDQPEKSASTLVEFYRRNDRSSFVLPPKVSDLLKNKQEVGAWSK